MKETKDEPKVEIVDETERCCKVVVSILSHEPVLAVACLGVQLASRYTSWYLQRSGVLV